MENPYADDEEDELAGRFRRVAAICVDLVVTISVAHLLFGLLGLFVPVDGEGVLTPLVLLGLAGGFFYLAFATPLVGNTLGKWKMGIKVFPLDADLDTLPWYRWLFRVLLVGLWPINLIMVLAHPQRRHLGDLAAQTWVLVLEKRNLFISLVGCVVLIVASGWVGGRALRLAARNTSAYEVAAASLEGEGLELAFLPVGMVMQGSVAAITFDVGEGRRTVGLERAEGVWTVSDGARVFEVDTVGFSSGNTSISGM